MTDHNMTVYPNPTDNAATLQIYLEKAGYVSTTLFSSTGQEYGELESQYYNADITELSFSFKSRFNLTKGAYFIRIANEHTISTIPLIIN